MAWECFGFVFKLGFFVNGKGRFPLAPGLPS